MKSLFESLGNVSVGNIESVRVNKNNLVKYEIAYLDKNGKEHKAWSNWMRDDGYGAGTAIPVQSITIPLTFGLCSTLLEVDGIRQQHAEPFAAAMVIIAVGMFLTGFFIGKEKKK